MGAFALIPQVVDVVKLPVIAAGGIADGRGLAAAFALGAEGVHIGTAFLPCAGSGASEAYRSALSSSAANGTDLTDAFTGRLASLCHSTDAIEFMTQLIAEAETVFSKEE